MARKDYTVISVTMLKGGVGKSKTTMFLAQEFADRGEDVCIIDADPGTQGVVEGVMRMRKNYPDYMMPWDVAQWTPRMGLLDMFIDDQHQRTGADRYIVDVGAETPEVVTAVAIMSDQLVVPVGTYDDELARIGPTMKLIQGHAAEGTAGVLLTRVAKASTGNAARARRDLDEGQVFAFGTEIPQNREIYDRFGKPIYETGAYAALAGELLAREEAIRNYGADWFRRWASVGMGQGARA